MIKRLIFKIIVFFTKEYETWAYFLNYYQVDNKPRECVKCGCKEFTVKELDWINAEPIEKEIICKKCKSMLAYYDHGRYEQVYKGKYRFK